MLRKLRIKLVCINMVFLMGMLCVILGVILQFTRSNLEGESLQMMQAAAVRPVGPHIPDGPPGEVRLPYFVVRQDRSGRLLAEGDSWYELTDEEFLRSLMAAASETGAEYGVLKEYGLRFLRAGPPQQPRSFVFADISSEQATLSHLTRTCVLAGGLGFLAFLFISIFLARWAVRPVERVWEQQKQFVADASHELKTPLTVILTDAELLQNQNTGPLAGSILAMARQMRGLVESLLDLARADGGRKEPLVSLDLSRLVSNAILPFEAPLFERGLTLGEAVEEGVAVKGNAAQLEQVVDILLDNARKYAGPDGEVSVTLARKGRGRCQLSVSSPGEAIPQGELKNIFKRFYRLDKARSRDGSYGLGLSIAQTIVEGHRGKIWAESEKGRNTFYVELPQSSLAQP